MAIYIPQNSIPFNDLVVPQIRLLIVGPPGSGKTFNTINSFPNVVYADFDNGLTDERLKEYSPTILPFYDIDWCKSKLGTDNQCNAFKRWINTEARKLGVEQTLVIDSLTGLQDVFHKYTEPLIPTNKEGVKDGYYIWGEKGSLFRDLHILLKTLKCNIVSIMHTKEERDKNDVLIGKVTPNFSGGFKAGLCSHYTDVFVSTCTTPTPTTPSKYLWQVWKSDKYDFIKARGNYTQATIEAGYQNLKHK